MLRIALFSLFALASFTLVHSAPAPFEFAKVLQLDGLATNTVEFVGMTELNLALPTTPSMPASHHVSHTKSHQPDLFAREAELERRQIRVGNHDIAANSSLAHGGGLQMLSTLLRRKSKWIRPSAQSMAPQAEAHSISTPPSDTRQPRLGSMASPVEAQSTSTQPSDLSLGSALTSLGKLLGLTGTVRTEASYGVHAFLGTITKGTPAGNVTKADAEGAAGQITPREVLPDTYFRVPRSVPAAQAHVAKRHSFVVDTDALLPSSPDTTLTGADAVQSDAAWRNMGLLNVDSNRAPLLLQMKDPHGLEASATPVLDDAVQKSIPAALATPTDHLLSKSVVKAAQVTSV